MLLEHKGIQETYQKRRSLRYSVVYDMTCWVQMPVNCHQLFTDLFIFIHLIPKLLFPIGLRLVYSIIKITLKLLRTEQSVINRCHMQTPKKGGGRKRREGARLDVTIAVSTIWLAEHFCLVSTMES